jgi:GT2 family glycosyltransferase
VAAGRGEYLIFLDGDCAVLPDFVATHRRLAEKGWFVAGNRVLLGKEFTARVLASSEPFYGWPVLRFLKARLGGGINRVLPFLKLPVACGRKLQPRTWQKATGCNLALWRDDFYRVNGFDESFVGWGHEDSEFAGRLINAGIFRKDGRFAAPVLHLWHRTQDRGRAAENMRRVREHLEKKLTRAEVGIDGYS